MARRNGVKQRSSARAVYARLNRKNYRMIAALVLFCLCSCVADIMTGSAMIPVRDIISCLLRPELAPENTRVIVMSMRLPIALMALVVGFSLGTSGAVMQTILHNPLASPYTLGVGTAAGFGASLAIVLGAGTAGTSLLAFAFAVLVCMLIYLLGKNSVSSGTLVLSGIAFLFLFQALQALIQYDASETQNQMIVFWSFGSLQKSNWTNLAITAAVCAGSGPLIFADAWKYTALTLGDEKAVSLGVNVSRLKIRAFMLISLLSAVSVCFTGTIGFIGLAGPHIARMLVGEDQRFYMPVSALCGAALLSSASIISKLIRPGLIFPIGIITSIIGVPFFFSLVFKTVRGGQRE